MLEHSDLIVITIINDINYSPSQKPQDLHKSFQDIIISKRCISIINGRS